MKLIKSVYILSIFLFVGACQGKKPALVLQQGEINNEMHERHLGEITFMKDYVPIDEYHEGDMLSSIDFGEETNFGIRAYLDQTLTAYLHDLSPDLTVRHLCDKGNYQFTFYVDDRKVYVENLNTGAGSCEQRNANTSLYIPLASTKDEDIWGRFMWMRFFYREGGEKALSSSGSHLLRIELRPYIEDPGLKVGPVIARGDIVLNIIDKKVSKEEIAIQPILSGSDWIVSQDHYDKSLIEELNKKIGERTFKDITSVTVIKDGALLIEEYFNGANRSTLHDPRSVSKTITSTMMGIAIDEGYISGVEAVLNDFYNLRDYKSYSSAKDQVTIKSLMMMSSGFEADDADMDSPGNEEYMYPTDDWVKFALDLSMDSNKEMEKDWSYFTAGVVVLGDILNNKVPKGLEKYTESKLFNPLGISNYKWQYTPTEVPNTAGGLAMRSLDFAKYGQLYKNAGAWKGNQILSKKWVKASLSDQVARSATEGEYYGYLFWNKTFHVNDASYEVSYCTGMGGNKIFIFKDIPLVIVITATAYGRPYAHPQVDRMMLEYILPAIMGVDR